MKLLSLIESLSNSRYDMPIGWHFTPIKNLLSILEKGIHVDFIKIDGLIWLHSNKPEWLNSMFDIDCLFHINK